MADDLPDYLLIPECKCTPGLITADRWPSAPQVPGEFDHGGTIYAGGGPCACVDIFDQAAASQLAEVRRDVDVRGWTAQQFVDTGVSGSLERRPALDQLALPASFDWFNAQDGRISGAVAGERRAVGEDIEQPVSTLLHVSYSLP